MEVILDGDKVIISTELEISLNDAIRRLRKLKSNKVYLEIKLAKINLEIIEMEKVVIDDGKDIINPSF